MAGLLGASVASAQGTVRGRVTDAATGQPVADVQLLLVGSQVGAVTGATGDYVIVNAPAGARELTARRLGYIRQSRNITVTAGAEVRADFSLAVSASQLDQVVVTGTGGAVEKKTLGNSITTLDAATLTARNTVTNVSELLQGKAPGVSILPGSGAPGTAGEIRIRGASSLTGYTPVVFIDGIRMNIGDLGQFAPTGGGTVGLAQSAQVTSLLNNLNPNDIESIEVIKGPAAATLYGADAANGVIQIITKKGTRGQQRLQWTMRGEKGVNEYNLLPEDNYTTCDAARQAATVSATNLTPLWPGCQGLAVNTIITDNPFARDSRASRDGNLARTSLSMRGGGDRFAFYVAGDRTTEQGVLRNSDNANTAVRTNFNFTPNEKSDLALNVNFQQGRTRLPIQDESANGLLLSARRGNPGRLSYFASTPADSILNAGWRTIAPNRANIYQNYTDYQRYTMGMTGTYTPFSWFRNRLTVGFDRTVTQAQLLFLPGDIDIGQDPDAASGVNMLRKPTRDMVTIDYAATLNKTLGSYAFTTTLGTQVVGDQTETIGATGIGIGAPDVTLPQLLQRSTGTETFTENNSVGYFVQQQVGWKDRLFLTGAVRADDHSAFGTNFDLIVYPKFSVSYVLTEEPALQDALNAMRISTFKFRSAWGQAGRAPAAYSAPQTYTVDRVTLGTSTGSAIRTAAYGNPNLKPERGQELEVGADVGILNERIGLDFTYYNKTTSDMIQSVSIPPSTGFISTQLQNLGEVTNTGIELGVFGKPIQRSNLLWESRLNIATNRNRLESFGVAGRTIDTPSGQPYGSVQQHRLGYPLGGYWVTPALRAPDGSALLTSAGAAQFPAGDTARRYIGPSTPTFEWNWSNTVTVFKYFRVYALLDAKAGHFIYNYQERNRCQSNDNCWRVNNPNARFPKTAADTILFKELAVYRNAGVAPEWIEPADFIKLREISVSVDVPPTWLRRVGAQTASFTLSGRNLAIWSDYQGVDPEVNSYGGRNFVRADAYALPMMRRWTAAVNLTY
ncbi:MAG TPA: SusC/RagA family TonB-linked outer membrane protein [Gemmatimonas sp.]|uniref:SusC/RagA family TonB-linked outer membrane protein n=1 Tax=Gemmatimonas sp. TaxID=1962908 RepID=UPI002EDBA85B